jgi:two-component system nitrate/nitrite response regulator NarL
MEDSIRLLIVDDHDLARKGTASVFASEANMQIVGMAANGQEALTLAKATDPNVVIMDINMPIMDGIAATLLLKEQLPHIKVLVLTISESDQSIKKVMKSGAEGYALKSIDSDVLVKMVKMVNEGIFVFPPLKNTRSLNNLQPTQGLTAQQLKVAKLWIKELSAKEIARELDSNHRTVEKHVSEIRLRTQTTTKYELRCYLEDNDLL